MDKNSINYINTISDEQIKLAVAAGKKLIAADTEEKVQAALNELRDASSRVPITEARQETRNFVAEMAREELMRLVGAGYTADPSGYPEVVTAVLAEDAKVAPKMKKFENAKFVSEELRERISAIHNYENEDDIHDIANGVIEHLESLEDTQEKEAGYYFLHRVLEEVLILAMTDNVEKSGISDREKYLLSLLGAIDHGLSPFVLDLLMYDKGTFVVADWDTISSEENIHKLDKLLEAFVKAAIRMPIESAKYLVGEFVVGAPWLLLSWMDDKLIIPDECTEFLRSRVNEIACGEFFIMCPEQFINERPNYAWITNAMNMVRSISQHTKIDVLKMEWDMLIKYIEEAPGYVDLITAYALNVLTGQIVANLNRKGYSLPGWLWRILEVFFQVSLIDVTATKYGEMGKYGVL